MSDIQMYWNTDLCDILMYDHYFVNDALQYCIFSYHVISMVVSLRFVLILLKFEARVTIVNRSCVNCIILSSWHSGPRLVPQV